MSKLDLNKVFQLSRTVIQTAVFKGAEMILYVKKIHLITSFYKYFLLVIIIYDQKNDE